MSARKQGSNIDFQGNQALNQVIHTLSGAPSSPRPGQEYYNTSTNIAYIWNGTAWRPQDAAALTDGSVPISALATNPLSRVNHTGTQLASTISNLQATVVTYTLDTFAAPVAAVSFGTQKLVNVAVGSANTDGVNLGQVNSIVAAALAGQTAIKNPARAYAASNITLSGTQTVDGVSLAAGDRVLVGAQTTASQNGLYVVASGAWTQPPDGNTASEWVEGTEILIAEGSTYGGSIFRQTTVNPTMTTLAFVQTAKINTYTADGATLQLTGSQFSARLGTGLTSAGGSIAVDTTVVGRKASGTITHDGSTLIFALTHNLNNSCPSVVVRDANGNRWDVSDQATSANVVQLQWDTAQANGTVFNWSVFG